MGSWSQSLLDDRLNEVGSGKIALATPDDRTGQTNLWCCVTVDQTGRWVAFESSDSQIAPDDSNGFADIFVYQLKDYFYPIGSIQRVSNAADGSEGNGDSFNPVLSPEGNWIAFTSYASNFGTGDTNGVTDVFLVGIDLPPVRISLTALGEQANGASYFAAVSENANEVAFVSEGTNLVAGDTNGVSDIFLRDVVIGRTELVSVAQNGAAANGASTMPVISADGQLVVFVSAATNLVAGDTNGFRDIFLYDRSTQTMALLSKSAASVKANGDSWAPAMTADGRYVAFFSAASNLVSGDSNGKSDVFLLDRTSGVIERVSVGLNGAEANADSGGQPVSGPLPGNAWGIAVSADGRYVSFISKASNLVAGDTNGQADIFRYDRTTDTTVRINAANGQQASGGPSGSWYAGSVAMSGDASVIAYISDATNLLPGDTNPQPDVFVFQANEQTSPTLGTLADDSLVGEDGNQLLAGLSGNDVLNGLAGDDLLYGGGGDDQLIGGDGSDTLSGGEGLNALVGGGGDDIYLVDRSTDRVIELVNQGTDEVRSTVSITTPRNVEKVTLLGDGHLSANANSHGNRIAGNAGNNVITGGAGADILSGDAGNDKIDGRGGDDRIVGDAGDDTVQGGDGNDILEGGIGDDTLDGQAGQDTLYGQGGADKLLGGLGDDELDGGAGNDTLTGGEGRDTYVIDAAGDRVVESGWGEYDIVRSSVSYVLVKYVEELVLTGSALNGTGNAADNRITGNALNNTLDGGAGADQLVGGKGNDTYLVDGSDIVQEDAKAGTDTVRSSVDYLLGSNVENLVLLGNEDLEGTGNELANSLTGNAGDNRLDGGTGSDALAGGLGDDVYVVDRTTDSVSEAANAGRDRVETTLASYTLGANLEDLWLYVGFPDTGRRNGIGNELANELRGTEGVNTLQGLAGDDRLIGNGGADRLEGGLGNDLLDGGTGGDTMLGGGGGDSYVVDSKADSVQEDLNAGTDTVTSSVSFTLGANVEHLVLTGFSDVTGTGNDLANTITGNERNNVLDGKGGADTLAGDYGDDTYFVDNAADKVVDEQSEGTDTVKSLVSWTLGQWTENLTLLGSSTLSGTGNASDNELTGNSGANKLLGGLGDDVLDGGAGNDTLTGGEGRDTYVVDAAGDRVVESGWGEYDIVRSSVSYVLVKYVEELVLTGSALNGTGNAADNRITGNALNNTLDGGAGADQLVGGKGNDTYLVDGSDIVQEDAKAGTDTVRSSVDYLLGSNVENLVLLGNEDLEGTGNELANSLTGNAGDNRLDGGTGSDALAGGLGDDVYVVDRTTDSVSEAANAGRDRVETTLASYTLGANLEDLWLYVGFPDTGRRNGIGNELANELRGTEGVNTLQGLAGDDRLIGNGGADRLEGGLGNDLLDGGTGGDTMLGGGGGDSYVVDSKADSVQEDLNAGTDTVTSSVSFTLGANVEHLVLTGFSDVTGTGNDLANTITGNERNNVLDGKGGADTLAGDYGDDTYFVDNAADKVVDEQSEGTDTVKSLVSWTLGQWTENLTLLGSSNLSGTGNASDNELTGNSGANKLLGGLGDDVLDGGAGNDTLTGGEGRDTYVVDAAGDRVVESGWGEYDIVRSSVSYVLVKYVEELVLTGSALNGTGNAADNRITGNALNNTLDGGAGSDQLAGGKGNDTYLVDGFDSVQEDVSAGTDTVHSSADYRLGSNVENLVLLGNEDLEGTGNELANSLTGNAGDNRLDGGTGSDALAGGLGDDVYVVDRTTDSVSEAANAGRDRVETTLASYTLGANLEDLWLYVGFPDTGRRNGIGNELANELRGTEGVNTLQGLAGDDRLIGNGGADRLEGGLGNDLLDGGTGGDTMLGGGGGDSYVVDSKADSVQEDLNAGTDTVTSSVSFTLGANVEHLVLTGFSDVTGTGNDLANTITGNERNNVLDGKGGADTLAGDYGDDTYFVDNAADKVVEAVSAGDDTIQASVSYELADEVEKLTLTGSSAINATGNSDSNILAGNSGSNIIVGREGADSLTGGLGADTFKYNSIFDSNVDGGGFDTIFDFKFAEGDRIDVSTVDANSLTAGLQHFVFIGQTDFSAAGQARWESTGSGRMSLYFNTNGDLGADMQLDVRSGTNPVVDWLV
jgi:Ca2+-binding RTX toxin-like protein